jgi:hypothetical protein
VVAEVTVEPASATLTEQGETQAFTARALDEGGTVISDATFTWASSDPSVASVDASTGVTTAEGDGTATITATSGGVQGQAQVEVSLGLRLTTAVLPAARQTLPYDVAVEVLGGTPPYTFTVTQGQPPAGLELGSDGAFQGTPDGPGSSSFTVRVEDSGGESAQRALSLTVCDPPTAFAVGDVKTVDTSEPGGCGVFLPSGEAGDRYRVALLRTETQGQSSDVRSAEVQVRGIGLGPATAASTGAARRAPALGPSARGPLVAGGLREVASATREAHLELRERERRELSALGVAPLPDLRPPPGLRAPSRQASLPNQLTFRTSTTCGTQGDVSTGLKIAESEVLAIYQEEGQNASDPVTVEQAQVMLDFYDDFGRETIESYFDGVPDINQDGKVVVFVSPAVDENENPVAAFVWSGDFFPRSQCGGSNERETIYMARGIIDGVTDGSQASQALSTLVHEMKHVSSLYQRLERWRQVQNEQGQIPFHPVWLEEGVAEIAAESALRVAWAEEGGAPVDAVLDGQAWIDALGERTSANDVEFGLLLKLFRTQEYLASQPNGLIVAPVGGREFASVYGSGWLFARWLGDVFGGAATGVRAEAGFWAELNDLTAPSGITGLTNATGRSWSELMEGWAEAVMTSETGAVTANSYTTYAFPSAIELWCFAVNSQTEDDDPDSCGSSSNPTGAFPWPVTLDPNTLENARSFASATYSGSMGPSGIRVHEFESGGTGTGAEVRGQVSGGGRMVVVRIE